MEAYIGNLLDPNPVNPTREQRYLAFLVCKNLCDLCETSHAIINAVEAKGHPIADLPERSSIAMYRNILQRYYSEDMFGDDSLPAWKAIVSFPKDRADIAYKLYRTLRNNIVDTPIGSQIQAAIRRRDRDFFVQAFDKIFERVPYKETLLRFKALIASPYITRQDQEYVWEYFDALLDIFLSEDEYLKISTSM